VQGAVIVVNSVSNTSITAVATANNVKTAYDVAISANTLANTASTQALTANTNAANASFMTSGTVAIARLPTANTTDYQINTADRLLVTDDVWLAANTVVLTDAATVTCNLATFINGKVTLGGNRTLGQPTSTKVGQSGMIEIWQDGTGSRTLAYHADWLFAGGIDPTLSTAANTCDVLFYSIRSDGKALASLNKAFA
jgi:flagellar basal body rod protein FlgF